MGNVKYLTLSPAQRAWWDDLYRLDPRSTGIDQVQVLECMEMSYSRVTEKRPIGFRVLKEY